MSFNVVTRGVVILRLDDVARFVAIVVLITVLWCCRIVLVLSQLSQAYFKAGNANAGNTYRKVEYGNHWLFATLSN